MRALRFAVGVCLGVALGLAMLVAGGIQAPAAPPCSHCAVLTEPYGGCDEAVQGGWICP